MRPALLILPFLACLACAQAPVLPGTGATANSNAPFPDLLPIDALLAAQPQTPQIDTATEAAFDARLADLRQRARRLSGPVVDSATRARMQAAISRAALR